MRLPFTKMHGAGNDFIVLDATRTPLALDAPQLRRLGDRRHGVGADQILVVDAAPHAGVDFGYRIFNAATGAEVEHCGNGARCFLRWVRDRGLVNREPVRVQTMNRVLELRSEGGGGAVDMGRPDFAASASGFDAADLVARPVGGVDFRALAGTDVAVVSMGNPHAVLRVADVDAAPVADLGPRIETDARFAGGVNVGFVQVIARDAVRLRVWERDAGETLSCGSGACAAVAVGIRAGWLDRRVAVATRGGTLTVDWPADDAGIVLAGPADTVFEGVIEL